MKASVVDLRKKMRQVMKALDRNETVELLYHGKSRARIVPNEATAALSCRPEDHPAFGLWKDRDEMANPAAYVRTLRQRLAMLIDTDVLVWFLRGNLRAAEFIQAADARALSAVSYMELLQGSRDRNDTRKIKGFLKDFGFRVVGLSENISHRAAVYMEEYALSSGLCVADALIAATAAEQDLVLATGNRKHFSVIRELRIRVFRP